MVNLSNSGLSPLRQTADVGSKHDINIRLPQTMVSGILSALGLRTSMEDPYVPYGYVACGTPEYS